MKECDILEGRGQSITLTYYIFQGSRPQPPRCTPLTTGTQTVDKLLFYRLSEIFLFI